MDEQPQAPYGGRIESAPGESPIAPTPFIERRWTDTLGSLLVVRNVILATGVLWTVTGVYFLFLVISRTIGGTGAVPQPPRSVQLLFTYGIVLDFILGGVVFFLIATSNKLWKT